MAGTIESRVNNISSGSGSGTVTSVGVKTDTTTSSIFANTSNSLTGSPVTSSGNITVTLSNQNANIVLAGPSSGSAAAPAFRALVSGDVPTLNQNTTGTSGGLTGTALGGDVTNSGNTVTVAKIQGFSTNSNYSIPPQEYSQSYTASGTTTFNFANGASQKTTTATGGSTFAFSNGVTGGSYLIRLISGGNFTITWPNSNFYWAGGSAPTFSTTSGYVDLISLYYDGTNWYGSASTGYQV